MLGQFFTYLCFCMTRPPDMSLKLENNFLIVQPKHMLWVLKRTVSMSTTKHMFKLLDKKIVKFLSIACFHI